MKNILKILNTFFMVIILAGTIQAVYVRAAVENGWEVIDGNYYWYENGVKQGTEGRGKEIYDPDSDAWYWLDAVDDGKKATSKDLYQESDAGVWAEERGKGKWVRYDENGHMIKGWYTNETGTYYFDPIYGTMAKGYAVLDGQLYYFDKVTGTGETSSWENINGWVVIDGNEFWYEDGVRQGTEGRGKEIYDPDSDAWYWLDAVDGGKKAVSKDVYQESAAGDWAEGADGTGKWVRYDEFGHMIKGWCTTETGTYYFDPVYGTMAKGNCVIEGREYQFDSVNGVCTSDGLIPTTPTPTSTPVPVPTLPPNVNEEDVVHSGQMGTVRWVITNDGQLVIVGTCGEEQKDGWGTKGAYDYTIGSYQCILENGWMDYRDEITSAYVGVENATNLSGLFMGLINLHNVDISTLDTSNVTDMSEMFYDCRCLWNLDVSKLDTSNVTDMSGMFYDCSVVGSLDVSSFDTSNVMYMGDMFSGCSALRSLDVSNFDTSKVTDMLGMFSDCSGLTSLDISNFDTTNVMDMRNMFYGCRGLMSLDVSSFDTSNVKRISGMFLECSELNEILVGAQWKINLGTESYYMFTNCGTDHVTLKESTVSPTAPPTPIPVPTLPPHVDEEEVVHSGQMGTVRWVITDEGQLVVVGTCGEEQRNGWVTAQGMSNGLMGDEQFILENGWMDYRDEITSAYVELENATNLRGLFAGLKNLQEVDVSNLDTINVTDTAYMFSYCSGLKSLELSSFNTTNVTNMRYMFYDCSGLTSLNLSNFNTTNVTDMRCMFRGCNGLTSLDVSSFNTSNVTYMQDMFYDCSELVSLDVSSFDTSNVMYMSHMFFDCSTLTSLDLSSFDTSKATGMSGMFSSCSGLTSLDLSNFDTSAVAYMGGMFSACRMLTSLDLSNFDTSAVLEMSYMFSSCSGLTEILVGAKWQINSDTYVYDMFTGCGTDHVTLKE